MSKQMLPLRWGASTTQELDISEGVSGEGHTLCSPLEFLDTEPEQCRLSPSCPLVHPDMAFI